MEKNHSDIKDFSEHDPDFKPLIHDIKAMREGKILY